MLTAASVAPAARHRGQTIPAPYAWTLIEDVERARGNYDHLLVGPAAVFLLETKKWTGVVSIEDGVPRLRRRHDPDAPNLFASNVSNTVLAASAKISRKLRRRTGRRLWVNAVVVFWSEFPQGLVELEQITYVHGSRLLAFLGDLPRRLDNAAVDSFSAALMELQAESSQLNPTADVEAGTARRAEP